MMKKRGLSEAHCNRSWKLERNYEGEKFDNSRYFEGKKIMAAGEKYASELGQYPVIKLSLKSAKQPDYAAPFLDKGYTKIIKYGICFCEKSCMVEIR